MIIKTDQVAVVTGAAQGLGCALAASLLDRGVSVVLADIAAEQLHTTAGALTARGGRVLPVVTDVSHAGALDMLASRTLDHFGRVDVVINNAGIATGSGQLLWRTDPEEWQRALAVNLLGVVHGIRAFMPHLVAAGAGHMVNIASLAGLMAMPFGGAYCASKHAVVAISEMLHNELEMLGLPIGVTVACPGFVHTPMTEGLLSLARADDDTATDYLPADLPREQWDQLRARLEQTLPTVLEPEVAAQRILAAVEADRLYALTHGDSEDAARHRVESILAALEDQG